MERYLDPPVLLTLGMLLFLAGLYVYRRLPAPVFVGNLLLHLVLARYGSERGMSSAVLHMILFANYATPALVFVAGHLPVRLSAMTVPAVAASYGGSTILLAALAPPVLAAYTIAFCGGIYFALLLLVLATDSVRLRLYAVAQASFPGVLIYTAAGAFPGGLFTADVSLPVRLFAPLLYAGLPLAVLWIGTGRADIWARFVISAPIVLAAVVVHWIMGTLAP